MNLEDISDNDSNPFEVDKEEEDDSIDLELESGGEDDEDQDNNMARTPVPKGTPKKKTTKRSASSGTVGETSSGEDLSSRLNQLDIKGAHSFCMDFMLPFILSTYNDDNNIMANIQIFVPTLLPKECFIPDVVANGTSLELRIQISSGSWRPGKGLQDLVATHITLKLSKVSARRLTITLA